MQHFRRPLHPRSLPRLLALVAGLTFSGLAAEAEQHRSQLGVTASGHAASGFGMRIAPTGPGPQQAGSATCSPAGSVICNGFTGGCDAVGGGLSSTPEGGVRCTVTSVPDAPFHRNLTRLTLQARGDADRQGEVSTCESDGTPDGDTLCNAFGQACGNVGCGPSTNSDGTVTCACQ